MIEFSHVCAGYGGQMILKDITFTVPEGSVTTLVGPNGCGKTTLLRTAARQISLSSGEITLDGKLLTAYDRKALARTAAFMPQVRSVPAITVSALVAHGRFPYLGLSRQMRSADKEAVQQAMEAANVTQWAHRDLRSLSGGERQRVYIAMALAQDTRVIFLDEPTTYLDLHQQFELLGLIGDLNRRGKTIVMVLHDLGHALNCSTQIVLMNEGRMVSCGTPEALSRSGKLEEVFSVQVHRAENGYYFTP